MTKSALTDIDPDDAGGTKSIPLLPADSRRLRLVLRECWVAQGQPAEGTILGRVDESNYRNRHFERACSEAGIGHRRPKDLRDTFASQLLTSGIQLGYVSRQLGHANVAITAQHYARWADGDGYSQPLEVQQGEVPADLLARLHEAESTPKSTPAPIALTPTAVSAQPDQEGSPRNR